MILITNLTRTSSKCFNLCYYHTNLKRNTKVMSFSFKFSNTFEKKNCQPSQTGDLRLCLKDKNKLMERKMSYFNWLHSNEIFSPKFLCSGFLPHLCLSNFYCLLLVVTTQIVGYFRFVAFSMCCLLIDYSL